MTITAIVWTGALALKNSGYDGPMMGDATAALFNAIANLETAKAK